MQSPTKAQFFNSSNSYFQTYINQICSDPFSQHHTFNQSSEKDHLIFFNALFSTKDTAYSLQKRNQNLQMINFDNSDPQPDQIYVRRKKKVSQLQKKQQTQLEDLQQIRTENQNKYRCLISLMQFFYQVKKKVKGIRTDYYSTKTFYALKNSSQKDIGQVTMVSKRMFNNIMRQPKFYNKQQQNGVDGRILQFLIIPRFLISKQKLNRLCRDSQLQQNFQFLVQHQCLGHYNNQANKKLPQQKQMKFIQQIIKKQNGRQKFKKICSINHGNKFLKSYGQVYFELYSKSLKYLRYLDSQLKKGRKLTNFRQQLQKFQQQDNQDQLSSSLSLCQSHSQSQSHSHSSSSNRFSFRSFRDALSNCDSEIKSQNVEENFNQAMKKEQINVLSNSHYQQPKKSGFKVKKSSTFGPKATTNIVLIEPPLHQVSQF